MSNSPLAVLVLSGKRKSGKDYVAECLRERFGEEKSVILRLSGPLKKQYALDHGLDYDRLLDATDYKEKYRADMIQWGESKRNEDPNYFCQLTVSDEKAKNDTVWMISDARRSTDIKFFTKNFSNKTILVRVEASEETRVRRGFKFTPGVDDAESECGLDSCEHWDVIVHNDGDETKLEKYLTLIMDRTKTLLTNVTGVQ